MQAWRWLSIVVVLLITACRAPEPPGPVILVTGATGTQGGAVARELLARNYRVRALTRSPDKPAAQALAAAGAEVVQGDYDDPESLRAAMAGAWGVFAVTDFWEHGYDKEVTHGETLIEIAEESGIGHFVFTSVAAVDQNTGLAHFDSKAEIERTLEFSDLDYTIVRPVSFMDNWRWERDNLLAGRFIDPRPPTARHQWIDSRDIGHFVAEAFDHPEEWLGRAEELAGDDLTLQEAADILAEVIGRDVEYVQVDWDLFEQQAGREITEMVRWFEAVGYSVNVEALREQHPGMRTVRQYLSELLAESAN